MPRHQLGIVAVGLLLIGGLLLSMDPVDSAQPAKLGPALADVQKVLDKAVGYLKTSQRQDGSFTPKIAAPGIPAIVVPALIRNGVSPDEPIVARGLKFME